MCSRRRAAIRRDTLFLPNAVPDRRAAEGIRDSGFAGKAARAVALTEGPRRFTAAVAEGATAGGLRRTHRVTIDPGHGGVDPAIPAFLPPGHQGEGRHASGRAALGEELRRRGVQVTMTRTRDTLIDLRDRGWVLCGGL